MMQDSDTNRVTIEFHALGPNHTSTSPMDAGDLKKLSLLLLGIVPTNVPKGFAAWLSEGQLQTSFKELVISQLAFWRSQCFEVKHVATNRVLPTPGGTLAERFRIDGPMRVGTPPIYEGREKRPWSVWNIEAPKTGEQESFYYHVSTIDKRLLEKRLLERILMHGGATLSELALTPVQIYDTIWHKVIAYDGRDYLFFLGLYGGVFPHFMRAWVARDYWRLREEVWDGYFAGAEDAYLVFGKRLEKV